MYSQVLEPGASSNPSSPHEPFLSLLLWWRVLAALMSQCVFSLFLDRLHFKSLFGHMNSLKKLDKQAERPLVIPCSFEGDGLAEKS
eukprot:1158329-Pelagomonas_calceolata.AAC.6